MASPHLANFLPYGGRRRGGYYDPNGGYGRPVSPLMLALMQIIQNKESQNVAQPLQPEGEAYYENDYLAPYLEGLTPLGRYTDMGLRDQAAQAHAMEAARAAATEKSRMKQILEGIRRTTGPSGETVATTPLNATVTTTMPAGPVAPGSALAPTAGVIDSPFGTGGIDTVPTPFTVGNLSGDEFFQREANADGANKYATPEPGYRGVPLTPGSRDWNSWEKATAMIRRSKK